MIDIAGIIVISCLRRTFLHTGTAFDTDTDIFLCIFRIDGTHRTYFCTDAAAAAVIVHFGFYLTDIDMITVSVLRLEVRMDGIIALHISRTFVYPATHKFFCDLFAKFLHHSKILCIRSAGCQCSGEGMFTDESATCHCFETICFQNVSQFHKGIVKITVAKGNHRYRQRTIAFYLFIQIRQQYIGHTTCNNRCTTDHNIPFAENSFLFAHTGQGPVIDFQRQAQFCRQCFCCCFYHFFCSPCRAEIHCPYFFHLHHSPPFPLHHKRTLIFFIISYSHPFFNHRKRRSENLPERLSVINGIFPAFPILLRFFPPSDLLSAL